MVTPNQFEAETLSGIKITNQKTAIEAMDKLHALGPRIVVITSVELSENYNYLVLFASKRLSETKKVRI